MTNGENHCPLGVARREFADPETAHRRAPRVCKTDGHPLRFVSAFGEASDARTTNAVLSGGRPPEENTFGRSVCKIVGL